MATGRSAASVYRWPWYREPFMSGGGGVRSGDFLREMSAMVREYG